MITLTSLMLKGESSQLPRICGVQMQVKKFARIPSVKRDIDSAGSLESVSSIDMIPGRRNSLCSLLNLKLHTIKSQYAELQRLIRQYNRQYNYVKTSLLQSDRLIKEQGQCKKLQNNIAHLHGQLTTDLDDFCNASCEDTGDLKLPIHYTQEVIGIQNGLKKLTPKVQRIVQRGDRQLEQTLRVLESSLYQISCQGQGQSRGPDTALDYLRNNLSNPIIADYVVYKGNGTFTGQPINDIIKDIIRYYKTLMQDY